MFFLFFKIYAKYHRGFAMPPPTSPKTSPHLRRPSERDGIETIWAKLLGTNEVFVIVTIGID